MAGIGVVIVTYNSADHIETCLDAALPTGAEIVVVDNSSSDATVKLARGKGVRCIANRENLGFAAAVNQGFRYLDVQFLLLLNPDAELVEGIELLRAACESPHVAGAGGRLIGRNGTPQRGFMVRRLPTAAALALEVLLLNRIWPNNPVNRRYRALDLDDTSPDDVEQPAGAFLMVRRDAWEQLGGFDEGFRPLWFEDVDFCRRAVDAGFRFRYVPGAVARHLGGYSVSGIPLEMRVQYWYGNLLRYAIKHFRPSQAAAVSLSVIAGSVLRMIFESVRQRSVRPLAAYGQAVRLAGRSLFRPRDAM